LNLVVDSYAWVEIFLGSEKGKQVKQLILEADEVRTPDVVLAEIARKYRRENIDDKRVKSRLDTITSTSLVTPIDASLAMKASKAYVDLAEKAKLEKLRSPSLFDAIILATAREFDARVITGDEHFQGLPETIAV
jgi:predicted nucleic acid-binding protein